MKRILHAILFLTLMCLMQGCFAESTTTSTTTSSIPATETTTTSETMPSSSTTEIPITTTSIPATTSTESTTTTSTVPATTTTVPSRYNLTIVAINQTFVVTWEDLQALSLTDIEIVDAYNQTKIMVGYRLAGLLASEAYDSFLVRNLTEAKPFQVQLTEVYLVIGEKQNQTVIEYDVADFHISRVTDKQWTLTLEAPTQIELRLRQPEEAVYFIEYKAILGRYDYHTSLRAMQGIINREKPRLLTITTGNPYYKYSDIQWLFYLESLGYDLIELESLEEVLYTFKDSFQGIIFFRDRMKSYNNWVSAESDFALMMASVMNFAPVPSGLQTTMAQLCGCPVVESFEVNGKAVLGNISLYLDQLQINEAYEVYEHVFLEFKEAFNTKAYMSLTSEVMDYASSEKMMFFDLKATQSERDNLLSRQINRYFDEHNDFFNVYGWVDHESSALDFISSYGGIIDVVGSGNLSLLHRLPAGDEPFVQPATFQTAYNPAKKYVTFFASESDTIKVGIAFQHGAWLDPNRGKVPINWGLIADMSQEFAFAYRYFIDSATPMDYFYSGGGSAIGFVDIDSQMNWMARNAIADANNAAMIHANQSIIDMYNDLYTSSDLFEKSVLGSYLSRSGASAAFARIHDGNTAIRVESWNSVPVYNRWTNFYPRRSSTSEANMTSLTSLSTNHRIQTKRSNYWFLETTLSTSQNEIGFELFRQDNGDGYQVVFHGGTVELKRIVAGIEETLKSQTFHSSTRIIKVSIDKATPLDEYTRIKLYVNDWKIFDFYDLDNAFVEGGFGIYSEDTIASTFLKFTGTKYSMAQAIYQRIVSDSNRFILAYYGFVGTEEYGNAQYRTEPGIGGVISLSPTDFYKIQLLLDANDPGRYEIVHANEFMQYAKQYQDYYGSLK